MGFDLQFTIYSDARPRAMDARSFFLGNVKGLERHEGNVRYTRHYAQRKRVSL